MQGSGAATAGTKPECAAGSGSVTTNVAVTGGVGSDTKVLDERRLVVPRTRGRALRDGCIHAAKQVPDNSSLATESDCMHT